MDDITINLYNVALAPDCNLNHISLGQLQKNEITNHDNPSVISLIRGNKIIIYAKRSYNLFIFDLAILD